MALAKITAPWNGDLDAMLARGLVRVGVSFSPLFFDADGPRSTGLTVDALREFEKYLRKIFPDGTGNLTVVLAPLPRDLMLSALANGHVDIVAANLTITPERQKLAHFSAPIAADVKEILVLGPASVAIADLDDLSGMTITVRASSSYHEHLLAMNRERIAKGGTPFSSALADEALEDEDLMELVSVGVLQATVVDEPKARLFSQIFDQVVIRDDLAINSGSNIAWAIRKASPKLSAAIDGFMTTARKGTLLGNIMIKRHLSDVERIRNALGSEDKSRYRTTIPLIEKHAATYDFDALMIAAQGYQESRLDQSTRSAAGAIGIMQVLPSTASDPVIGITDIETPDRNVEAGIKYLRHLRHRYLDDPAIDRVDRC